MARRLKALFPFGALAVVAVVAVATAMTILGDSQSGATAAPSASVAPATSAPAPLPTASPTDAPTPLMTVPLPSAAPVVLTIYVGYHDPNRICFVVWRYPQFRAGSTPLADLINKDILDEVNTRIATFEVGPAAVAQLPGKANTLTGSFTVDMLSSDLASFALKWIDDTIPGHPTTSVETLSYALDSGQRLDLGTLFVDLPAALTIISEQSRMQLAKSLGAGYDAAVVEPATSATVANFGNWALTEAGLKVTFAEYQVGTPAGVLPDVLIPWSSLKPVMRPDGPAARLAGFPSHT